MNLPRVAALTALILAGAGALHPCGGPLYYPIAAPFDPYPAMLDRVLGIDGYWGPSYPDQVTFLHPFALEGRSLGPADTVKLAGFRAALATGDLAAAEREARSIVERVLDMTALAADANQLPLRRAIEFLELRGEWSSLSRESLIAFFSDSGPPDVAGFPAPVREALRIRSMSRGHLAAYADSAPASPRAPSLRYVALQETMKRRIPNGWLDEIRQAAPAGLWRELLAEHERWLAEFEASPLADLVRFSKLRVFRFAGDYGPAWQLLLDYYPARRTARVVQEMRFLRINGSLPDSSAVNHPHFDGVLRAATTTAPASEAEWCGRWREAESRRPASWAVNIQERLLYAVATSASESWARDTLLLPACFPAGAAAPTPMWGRLRLMTLLAARRNADARAQLAVLDSAADLAPLRARFAIEDRRWSRAALMPGLDTAAVLYLVRVLAPDTALSRLATTAPLWIRREAALTRAVARAGRGDWSGGAALLAPVDSSRARRWNRLAVLARDTTYQGRLALARYLHAQRGRVMYPRDGVWLRSVAFRLPDPEVDSLPGALPLRSPIVADEADLAERHLINSTEDYLSLKVYAQALERASVGRAQLRQVVNEADEVYRALIDWQHASTPFWDRRLSSSPEAAAIRRAGRLARGT